MFDVEIAKLPTKLQERIPKKGTPSRVLLEIVFQRGVNVGLETARRILDRENWREER